jgi:hypothetical protein
VRQAQAAADEEEAPVKFDITKRALGELLSSGICGRKRIRRDGNTEMEQASEVALRRAKNDAIRSKQVRVFPLLHM